MKKEILLKERHFAFNIWDFESARAVIDAAAYASQDVILQTSTRIFRTLPARIFSDFVKSYSESKGICVWLNLDHCKEMDALLWAVDNGWDMVMADGSSFTIRQNIDFTNEVISYAHKKGVLVEAEVGRIKGIEDDINVQQDTIASEDDITLFLSSADVDFIAVAFGNAHGEYKVEPELHYDLVEYTTSITNKPFVVHGGSGLSDRILARLIEIDGVKKLNISTDLKMAYKRGLRMAISSWSEPNNASNLIRNEIMKIAASKMRLINEVGSGVFQ